jgi:hypothetical protein
MRRTLIPWHLFRQALHIQVPHDLENWLTWRFADEGVAILQDESGIQDVIQLLFPDEKDKVIH